MLETSDPKVYRCFLDKFEKLRETLQSLNPILLPCKGSSSIKFHPFSQSLRNRGSGNKNTHVFIL